MNFCIALVAALLFTLSPTTRAAGNCSALEGMPKVECEANRFLDHGIARFQRQSYGEAKKDFLHVVQVFPQATETVARARFYSEECDRLGATKKAAAVKQELKFKPATTHGQILSPGEKPPAVTLRQSQRDLTPAATAQTPAPVKP